MFTYETLLAAALATAPPGVSAAPGVEAWHAVLARPLMAFGVEAEILDERELVGLFQQTFDFVRDVRLLQSRHEDLLDAPRTEECRRFPPRQVANQCLAFNRAVREDLLCRIGFDRGHAEELESALSQVDHAHEVWSSLRDAAWTSCYVNARRDALRQLRTLIGPEAFYRGQLPPAAPAWLVPSAP